MRFTIVATKPGQQPPQSSCDFLPPGGTIGRGADNNLVLPDDGRTISRLQAIVHITADGECRITNRGNVTLVHLNDIPLERGRQVDLQDGDILSIDEYRLQVSELHQTAQPAPQPVRPVVQPAARQESAPAAIPSEIWDSLAQEFSISDSLSSRSKPAPVAANPLTEKAPERNPVDPLAQFAAQQGDLQLDRRKQTPDALFSGDSLFEQNSIFDDSTPGTLAQRPQEQKQGRSELDPMALFGGDNNASAGGDDPLGLMGNAVPLTPLEEPQPRHSAPQEKSQAQPWQSAPQEKPQAQPRQNAPQEESQTQRDAPQAKPPLQQNPSRDAFVPPSPKALDSLTSEARHKSGAQQSSLSVENADLNKSPLFAESAELNRSPLFDEGAELNKSPLFAEGADLNKSPLFDESADLNKSPLFDEGTDLNKSPLFDEGAELNKSPLFAESAEPDADFSQSPLFASQPQSDAAAEAPPHRSGFSEAAPHRSGFSEAAPQPVTPPPAHHAQQQDYGGITLPTPQAVARSTTPPPKGRLRIDPVSNPVAQQSTAADGQRLDGELLEALMGGMGLNDLQPTPRFDRDSMQELGQMLSMFSQGTVALLSSRSILKRGVKAEMTVILDEANNPFKLLPSGKSVLMQMFGSRMPGFMPPKQSVRDALVDLQAHQLGMIAGIRAIIASMLQSFNPQQLEEEARGEGAISRLSLPNSRKAALWEHFTKRYGETAGEIEDDFHTLFGEAFLHAYDMEVNQYKDSQIRSEE